MGLVGRIIRMAARDGPMNMGLDEALARLCRDEVVLRFYEWNPPALSIGYFQRAAEIDLATCRKSSISVVRRPTGGRAVLHGHDLTYSLILPLRPPWSDYSIAESYRRINTSLQQGLQRLGVPASMETPSAPGGPANSPFCFSAIVQDELLVNGKKLVGSAQRRFPAALLQQGSILVDVEAPAVLTLFRAGDRSRLEESLRPITSLQEALGRRPDRAEVEAAIVDALGPMMEIRFREGALEPGELDLAMQ
ncbi:MAG: lipoate--protein ligase family protein, partial [Candidatus Methylomirabilaceae bacterium]